MSLVVLFAMLFQTIHSYEHVFKQITEKQCHHSPIKGQKQITHSHSVDTTCHVCHFAFSTYIPNPFKTLFFNKINVETSDVFFYTSTESAFFKGSLFALRAPPALA